MSTADQSMSESGSERVVGGDRRAGAWVAFFAIVAAAWAGLFLIGHDGLDGAILLPGLLDPEAWLQFCITPSPPTAAGITFLMWGLMVLGMMLPAATPLLATFSRLPLGGGNGSTTARWWAMATGHACVWLGFALVAAALQIALAGAGLLTSHGVSVSGGLSVLLLAMAGLYQFSPLKAACLSRCRSPMRFLIANWRDGLVGAWRMGLSHGLDCLGCCWALMLLAFIGGSMNPAWMGVATALMILEKLQHLGRAVSAPLGVLLLAGAGIVGWNTWSG